MDLSFALQPFQYIYIREDALAYIILQTGQRLYGAWPYPSSIQRLD